MNNLTSNKGRVYYIICYVLVFLIALTFLFPLYWIITGSFKVKQEILSATPVWIPTQWVTTNFENLFAKRSAPLFEIGSLVGPTIPGALRWLLNTVFMSAVSMLVTCLTAAMAGYALAKKRFYGRTILFSLIVAAMALPKQVIL
ncbi:MAG: carbohydrate ABC transporter permease, partial [Oscillospiraceae bacterium]|nr:carbohydrate ABC transporter permease [Oscillospiraceae bacterium]